MKCGNQRYRVPRRRGTDVVPRGTADQIMMPVQVSNWMEKKGTTRYIACGVAVVFLKTPYGVLKNKTAAPHTSYVSRCGLLSHLGNALRVKIT